MKLTLSLSLMAFFSLGVAVSAPNAIGQTHHGHDHSAHESQTGSSNQTPLPTIEGAFSEVAGDHAIGNPQAENTLIVVASVTCPHCASWFKRSWPKLKRTQVDTGSLRVVFRELPTQPAQVAMAGFLIAACGPSETYFDAITYQMANQSQTIEALQAGKVQQTLNALGAAAGLTPTQTASCLTDKAGYDRLNQTVARVKAANIKSVPAMILNGALYTGKDTHVDALSTAIKASQAP